ncbi:MAG: nucleoside hydrolase [Planctomycetaceae bacterium]
MKRPLIIDADPGIGDALTVALALLEPTFDVIGLTSVAGRVSGEMGLRNLQGVASLLDPPRWPRIGGGDGRATSQPTGEDWIDPVFLDGETGLGECTIPHVDLHHRVDSVKLLVELVRDRPHDVTILSLGPLTNLAAAEERHPGFLSQVKEIVILGGAWQAGGDITAAAEFNIYSNPAAARSVLLAAATKTIIPRDISSRPILSFDLYQRQKIERTTRLGRLIEETVPFALRTHRQYLGTEGVPLAGIVAIASLIEPKLFERTTLPVDVVTQTGPAYGMTLFDRRPRTSARPNIDLLTHADWQGVIDFFIRRLRPAILN